MTVRFRHYLKNKDGSFAVEAALIFPFLVVAAFGSVDGAILMLENHKIEAGLTSAGNYLARMELPETQEGQAKRLAVTGQIESGGQPVVSGWSESDIIISYRSVSNSSNAGQSDYRGEDTINIIELSTAHEYNGIGILKGVSGGNIRITATHEERAIGGS